MKKSLKTQTIKCSNCGKEINIADLIQEGMKDSLNAELAKKDAEFNVLLKEKEAEQKALLEELNNKKEQEFQVLLKEEQKKLKQKEEDIKAKVAAEQEDALKTLQLELDTQNAKLKELNKLKAENAKLEREKESLKDEIVAEQEEKLRVILQEERKKIKENAETIYELKIIELEEKLRAQKAMLDDAQKRIEQGSMQLQGEVQEIAIEKYLKENFLQDDILEIFVGERGADVLQIVKTPFNPNCGSIYYESKRAKKYNNGWIKKLKEDMQAKGADIGVLVTSEYPEGMDRMGMKDGIYICSYPEFKALSAILRTLILQISEIKDTEENKLDKKELLYKYLTGSEFKLHIESIVNSFQAMHDELQKERKYMTTVWKKREENIKAVLGSTCSMYGSIKGIAGGEVQNVETLEIPLIEDKS
ncbi:MAG: DUF2130 domain-containing protein [Cyanobacteria bacterium RUI128]|nr:DUF2130 domain-containing protein [Cyanobacteria bacterium RUI128]